MTISEFIKELEKINIYLTDEQLNKFEKYANFLLEYNKTINLTAIRDKESVYLKHFYDSILITYNKIEYFNKAESLIDIGTGAGFPGVVIKILYPNINLTLLDSNNKKTKFLEQLVKELELKNVTVVNDRAEKFIKNNRHKYDISTARAVSELRIISELCLPFTKIGGTFIALKGYYENELKNAESTLNILNSKVESIEKFELPKEGSYRANIFIKLLKEIDEKYPRSYEQIIKKQLK